MQVLHIHADAVRALVPPDHALPPHLPTEGFVWMAIHRDDTQDLLPVQNALPQWGLPALVDLHLSDLGNAHLRSQFDETSSYDLLVFRRLALQSPTDVHSPAHTMDQAIDRLVQAIDTSPIGFVVFDRLLLSVHPTGCPLIEGMARRLADWSMATETRGALRLPNQPSDLMLRMCNHMVDGYLDLRRALSATQAQLEQQLFDPQGHFHHWQALLHNRQALHSLEDTCEDQRSAIVEWLDAFEETAQLEATLARQEQDLLKVRARDVVEHIDRVLTHVRRLQSASEAAVQIHLSSQSNRTNDTMRTLTVLTAIFLPLNLLTGFFGMNFESLPLIHSAWGFWLVLSLLVVLGLGLSLFFWRRRLLSSSHR